MNYHTKRKSKNNHFYYQRHRNVHNMNTRHRQLAKKYERLSDVHAGGTGACCLHPYSYSFTWCPTRSSAIHQCSVVIIVAIESDVDMDMDAYTDIIVDVNVKRSHCYMQCHQRAIQDRLSLKWPRPTRQEKDGQGTEWQRGARLTICDGQGTSNKGYEKQEDS